MVTDAILTPLLAVARWLVGLLPVASLDGLPGLTPLLTWLGRIDSLVPIGGVLTLALGVLSYLVAFVTIRAVLTVWHIVWP